MPHLYGGVAQLGEHLPCKQGVKSSNLSISIGYTGKCIRMHLENCILETKKYKKREISNTTSNQEMKERPIIMTLHNDEVKGCRGYKGRECAARSFGNQRFPHEAELLMQPLLYKHSKGSKRPWSVRKSKTAQSTGGSSKKERRVDA